ncbi:hypothetical protein L226DRAFT_609331 [Lentinus tigrinus ALCF2SS1-7]|uniref:Uncharacterized protein n=1 Tax=Lentinus tigrinus ALCF2SS1-6 TaxID=1328759 RepID=A0A5C2SRM8_9APHY|nr:hypothetical protein L227DRAFT_649213 [Lentinus tigrinus ALCF2SS1-6]RPD80431.1 hypothetical protein L226DRAFT_609331 [Lentinus tigrinus ALCF2SS1-7]
MFPTLDTLRFNASNILYDSRAEPDLLRWLTYNLETALAHLQAVVSIRSFSLCASLLFASFVLLLHFYPRSLVRTPARVAQARKILQALLTIITPTQSVWPRAYVNLAYFAAATGERSVPLPLQTLYEDVVKQRIELRNPKLHLPLLFRGALARDTDPGLSFVLNIGPRLQMDADHCRKRLIVRTSSVPATSMHTAQNRQDRAVLGPGSSPCCSLFLDIFHQDMPSVSLDCIPPASLHAHLEDLKAALASGSFLMLGLTSLASAATLHQARLATVPFLPRKAKLPQGSGSGSRSSRSKLVQRSTTPLRTSVTQVIDMLKSGGIPVTVEIVQNVSRDYADFMHGYVDNLEQDADVRAQFVREWGMEAWVEERFCTVWEAALVEVGLLEAWTIIVRKPE